MSDDHKLIDNVVKIEADADGKTLGCIARCTCGWSSGYRFSSSAASAALMDHQERCKPRED